MLARMDDSSVGKSRLQQLALTFLAWMGVAVDSGASTFTVWVMFVHIRLYAAIGGALLDLVDEAPSMECHCRRC